ncbi:MAG: Acetyltransferase (GNAT) family protein [candidate division WS6 bacterium OLB20]|uniref:Acetyltransferase (GNAT) family protein n=1 Tax=candidate division WS6 bacterium OLB20 TaxID=1617426 RepID=A0A136LX71_9BACT|nr:MAG: Acetyltransferase (GNAT) family protein [candidate division WS6 bacterium OLB20]
MNIVRAQQKHTAEVLSLLDAFRTYVNRQLEDPDFEESRTARNDGEQLLRERLEHDQTAVFLAMDAEIPAGIVTVHLVPLLRKGRYKAEVEEFFVIPEYHGTSAAKSLMDAASEWAVSHNAASMTLDSANGLDRAHAFYRKYGFAEDGKAFSRSL